MICHVTPLPPVPAYTLRLLRDGDRFGAPYLAVATLLQHPDCWEIVGLLSRDGWRVEHHDAVSGALWQAGMRGIVKIERSRRVAGE